MKLDTKPRNPERYAFIETQIYWGGGLTAGDLAQAFGMTRQAAQAVLDRYRRHHPGQIRFDPASKRQVATEQFRPAYISPEALPFLDYLRGEELVSYYLAAPEWSSVGVVDVDRWLRPHLAVDTVRIVFAALRRREVIAIDYDAREAPIGAVKAPLISPNHLVFADNRYHLRAYCHNNQQYFDFVLTRIGHAEATDEEWVSSYYDDAWNEHVQLQFMPHPELPEPVRSALLCGYDGPAPQSRKIVCRRALAFYIKRKLLTVSPVYGVPLWQVEEETPIKS